MTQLPADMKAYNRKLIEEFRVYHNLVANPAVTVEVTGETYPATAVVTSGDERDRLFAGIAQKYPFFIDHQAQVTRTIPVVALVRA